MESLAIYVHVPFCVRKCSYCDFNAYSGMGDLAGAYVEAVLTEVSTAPEAGRRVGSVFFGGGTPTYLAAEQLAGILGAIHARFQVLPGAEITAEANPTTVDAGRFAAMREAGFNRISVGVQAFDDRLLKAVEREHSAREAECAVAAARTAGFENVSIDLMFGLPGQSLADWEATLQRAIDLGMKHVSTYALTLEPGTRFERLHKGGRLQLPDEDTELTMYEGAIERLTSGGFEHYEVSNFARQGFQSRHNLVYWRNEEYLGFGPGAVSYVDGRRWMKERHPAAYVEKVRGGVDLTVESEQLDPVGALSETLIQGLRLREGVSVSRLRERLGVDPLERFGEAISRLTVLGHLEHVGDALRLTHKGLLFANDVALKLLP